MAQPHAAHPTFAGLRLSTGSPSDPSLSIARSLLFINCISLMTSTPQVS